MRSHMVAIFSQRSTNLRHVLLFLVVLYANKVAAGFLENG
jgi:hypothetical protein